MVHYTRNQLNPFFIKMIIVLTMFISSFFLKEYNYYPTVLKIICYFILVLKPIDQMLRNFVHKKFITEAFLITLASIINMCIGKIEETIVLLIIYNVILYTNGKWRQTQEIREVLVQKKKQVKKVELSKVKVGDTIFLEKNQPNFLKGKLLSEKAIFTKDNKNLICKVNTIIESGMIPQNKDVRIKVLEKYKNSSIYEYDKNKEAFTLSTKKELETKPQTYRRICTLLALFLIFIPNLITGEIQRESIHLGVLLLVISNSANYQEIEKQRNAKFLKKLLKEKIQINNYKKISLIPKIKNIIFEKTGTLTLEEFRVTEIEAEDKDELWNYLSYAEYHSDHAIAQAIRKHKLLKIDAKKIKKYQEYPSRGVECKVENDTIVVGNAYFLKDKKIEIEKVITVGTVLYIAVNQKYLGYVVLSDSIKKRNKSAIAAIKEMGINNLFTLSGDNERIVNAVSKELGILDKYSNLTLDEKLFWTKHLKEYHKGITAIVGNVNTASELLEQAEVSIILSKENQVSFKGDIEIIYSNLQTLPQMIEIVSEYEEKRLNFKKIYISLKWIWIVLAICQMLPIWLPLLLEEIFCILEIRKEKVRDI